MNPNTDITLCVTSCDRHDLLRATLDSFFAVTDVQPQQIVIYEDSGESMPEFLKDWEYRRRQPLMWISDGERKGQAYACARLIREIRHDWVFWLEDDWLFQRGAAGFMRESKKILESHPEIIKVSLRGDTGWHPLERSGELAIAKPYWHGVWGGWAWNPGLSRAEDVRALLPRLVPEIGESGLKHEEALSKGLLDDGRRIADLGRPIVTHIGGGRSRAVEKLPPLPRILVAVPTCFEFDYESHRLENREGFHVNGPNEQTQAVRDTWGPISRIRLSPSTSISRATTCRASTCTTSSSAGRSPRTKGRERRSRRAVLGPPATSRWIWATAHGSRDNCPRSSSATCSPPSSTAPFPPSAPSEAATTSARSTRTPPATPRSTSCATAPATTRCPSTTGPRTSPGTTSSSAIPTRSTPRTTSRRARRWFTSAPSPARASRAPST